MTHVISPIIDGVSASIWPTPKPKRGINGHINRDWDLINPGTGDVISLGDGGSDDG